MEGDKHVAQAGSNGGFAEGHCGRRTQYEGSSEIWEILSSKRLYYEIKWSLL